jgi:hypothetical protein
MATDEQKEEFKELFDFPEKLDIGHKTLERADLIDRIINKDKAPELGIVQNPNRKH